MKLTKNRKEALAKVDKEKAYSILDAAKLVKEITTTKFDASVDMDVRLGVDPKKANQMVRGTVSLPNGTGKTVRVLAICQGADAEAALDSVLHPASRLNALQVLIEPTQGATDYDPVKDAYRNQLDAPIDSLPQDV